MASRTESFDPLLLLAIGALELQAGTVRALPMTMAGA
jgi:hypothetical protein